MDIAIIGAGVSGLTTAYYLSQNPALKGSTITIYEKAPVIGGNADTFFVDLPDGKGGVIKRWVDMGVNDFNLSTYKPLRELWQELGIMNFNKPCPAASNYCSPLIDTESFSFPGPDGGYYYRYSLDAKGNVIVPAGSIANGPVLQRDIDRFKTELAAWYTDNETEGKNPVTVAAWLASFTGANAFSDDFINYNLYPRINGMYFTMEEFSEGNPPPGAIPLWMVAHYYILQEAYGQEIHPSLECSRQYFINGSRNWLSFLADKLQNDPKIKANVTVNIWCSVPPITAGRQGNKMTIGITGSTAYYDKIIFATHADDTYKMMATNFGTEPMVQALPDFTFSQCQIFVHQDATFLNRGDCNQTYNIHAYDYSNQSNEFPYTISYIVNMHQNDPANPAHSNDPLFFCTLNPYWNIDPTKVLNQSGTSIPAQTTLSHCKLDKPAMDAQVLIDQIQLETPLERTYYFAGSFTRGAGLHMECIIQAQEIAKKIANPSYISDQTYKFNSTERHFAPKYIMEAITRVKKKD